jgi:hypothetical protein
MMFHFYIPEGICFAAFVASVEQRQLNVRPSTINLHADGNIASKLIEQYSAAGC